MQRVRLPSTLCAYSLDQAGCLSFPKLFKCATAMLLFLAPVDLQALSADPAKPNILYILADDLGYGDVSFQNPNSKIRTPRLDGLAAQGMCFSSAHAPSALCTPSRYSILCGEFCWRSRLKSGVLHAWDEPVLPSEKLTVPTLLREHGYATGCFGKWHLGLSWPFVGVNPAGFDRVVNASDINWNGRISGGPVDHGFDYYFGVNIANEPPYAYVLNDRIVGFPSVQYESATGLQSHWAGPGVPGWDWSQVLPDVVSNAVGWLEGSTTQAQHRPFFLYLALPGPHQPVVPTAQFTGTSGAGLYGDYVQELDWAVGQVLDKLEATGASTNTLVIFTSDNGPDEFAYDRLAQYRHSSMGNLRGIKNDVWEGGLRVPFLARWPGKITAGSSNSQVICHVDFMRTVADLIGASLPADAAEDSISFLPALLGGQTVGVRSSLVLESGQGQFGFWTNGWMYIDSRTGDGHNPELEPLWFKQARGYPATNIYPALLYDLVHDLPECTNLYAQQFAFCGQLQAGLHHERGLQTWCGVDSASWTNRANWSQQSSPAGCDLVYSNTITAADSTQILGANLSINSLSFLGATQRVTVQAGGPFSLTISNGLDMSLACSDLLLETPVCLAQSQVWTVCSNRTLTTDAPISLDHFDLMLCGPGNFIFSNSVSGSGELTIRGSGFVVLAGSNTFSGGIELSGGGFLAAQHPQALGSGPLDIPNHSTLQVGPGVSLGNPITVYGYGGTLQNHPRGALNTCRPGIAELSGPVSLVGDAGISAQGFGSFLVLNGPVSGNGNLTVMTGAGTVVLGATNFYTGTTVIHGRLKLAGGPDRLPKGTQVLLADSTAASLDLNGNPQTVRSLSGGGTNGGSVALANGVLTIDQDLSTYYAGSLSGAGEVVKTGTGMLTLAGACAYTGLTMVRGGGLQVNGELLDSSIIVSGGTLGGTGLISGPVTIETSGILSPGPGLGTLTISNSLTLTDGSTTVIQVDPVQRAASRVEGLNQINYAGSLVVNNPEPSGSLSAGDFFQIFGASTATGTFSAIQPSPGPGLAWSFDSATGTLSVVNAGNGALSAGTRPPIRASRVDTSHLVISWPVPGFRLQAQTNSISNAATNWFDYPGSITSPLVVPIDPKTKALFFRLVP